MNLGSFASAAQQCDQLRSTVDLNGNSTQVPQFQCNLLLTDRRSAADVARGIKNGSALSLCFDQSGLLMLQAENTLALQQPTKPAGSNSQEPLGGGWPAYDFGDNSFSGIVRNADGSISLRTTSRSTASTPNFFTIEFQDEFNEYQQDSLSLVALDDVLLTGQEVTTTLMALGLPNFDQATRMTALQLSKSVYGNTTVEFETSVRGVGLRPGDIIALTYSKEGFNRQPFRITRIAPSKNYRTAVITAQIHDDAWYSATTVSGAGSGRQAGSEVGLPRPLVGTTLDSNGQPQFGIAESSTTGADGTISEVATVSFNSSPMPAISTLGLPLASLSPQIVTIGGTLNGNRTYYYGLSALDSNSAEGPLSFVIPANVPAGTNTNQVTLVSLSFSSTSSGFRVYRGTNPTQLLRIADVAPIAGQYVDTGATPELLGPPDQNYDHANFYWRLELQPEVATDIYSKTTAGNSALNMLANEFIGSIARITQGTGLGQERVVAGNTATTVMLNTQWDLPPDTTSQFLLADSTWQFGASANASPVSFAIPNRPGATIHVSGRSANILDQECAYALSPLTRWRIEGFAGSNVDTDVPGAPSFGLLPTGQGTVEVQGVGFPSLTNTATVDAGTLTLAYWDELGGPSLTRLATGITATDTVIVLSAPLSVQAGDLIQIESEVVLVQVGSTGNSVQVDRAAEGSSATVHNAQVAIYELAKKTFVMPFPPDFFGSPASGSYAYPVFLPDVRISAAELFVTNSRGNSDVTRQAFTNSTDQGLRTLAGGQLSIQVQGMLAIQTNASPPLLVESTCTVRDVYAVVQTASTGSPIVLQITQNGQPYCGLTIPVGATVSNIVDGFGLGPLQESARVGLDITSVSQTSDTLPGSDLTVTIRL